MHPATSNKNMNFQKFTVWSLQNTLDHNYVSTPVYQIWCLLNKMWLSPACLSVNKVQIVDMPLGHCLRNLPKLSYRPVQTVKVQTDGRVMTQKLTMSNKLRGIIFEAAMKTHILKFKINKKTILSTT